MKVTSTRTVPSLPLGKGHKKTLDVVEGFFVALPAGLEPATPGLGNQCSIRLSYGSTRRQSGAACGRRQSMDGEPHLPRGAGVAQVFSGLRVRRIVGVADGSTGVLDGSQDVPGVGKQGLTAGQKAHAAWDALEERGAEFVLEGADLARERRLADVQALRGAPDVLFFCDGDEIAQLIQAHPLSRTGRDPVATHDTVSIAGAS